MYNIENNEKFYIYDLRNGICLAAFSSMHELREYMYNIWAGFAIGVDKESFTMEFKVRDERFWRWYTTSDGTEIKTSYCIPRKFLIILDKRFQIFNYTELFDEFEAHWRGDKITFGVGHTYKGNPDTKSYRRKKVSSFVPGSKCVDRSRAHRCIKFNEQTKTFSVPRELISDVAEETNLSEAMINKAYNSMRGDRKYYCKGNLRSRDNSKNKYGSPVSWKSRRKSKQWSNKTYHTHHQSKAKIILNNRYNEEMAEVAEI